MTPSRRARLQPRRASLRKLAGLGGSVAAWAHAPLAWARPVPASAVAPASRVWLDLSRYQRSDGALITHVDTPDEVDPYFGLKAIWLAHRLGMEVGTVWRQWATWMVTHQDADGRWGRWAVVNGVGLATVRARDADADDALLALWLQCVAELGLPPDLQDAHRDGFRRASAYLLGPLFDVQRGVYRIFADEEAHLWMDNIEVWSALQSMARADLGWCGPWAQAVPWQRRADSLAQAMRKVFASDGQALPKVSTQRLPGPARFYPHLVTAPFAWLHGWTDAPQSAQPSVRMALWSARHEAQWVAQAQHDYPWGLLAAAAWQDGAHPIAARWLQRAQALRGGPRWNILEEAAWQALSASWGGVTSPLTSDDITKKATP